jgi:nicotinamide-nucleotide amidase
MHRCVCPTLRLKVNVMARAAILSIGDELLLGEIVDTNSAYLSQELVKLGLEVVRKETVGDNLGEIVALFRRALECADIVVSTGGLGPTDDDLTQEGLAQAVGVELVFHDDVMMQMAARLKRPVESFSPSNRKQAMLPRGAKVLVNRLGTAPGVHLPVGASKHVFLMAGVPTEMKGVFGDHIRPLLQNIFPRRQAIVVKSLHSWGLPESLVGERIAPLMKEGCNPNVGTRVKGGVVTVRLVATGPDEAAARAVLEPAAEHVRQALKAGLFGEDQESMAQAALKALVARRLTVALAESCTAGLATSLLAENAGTSEALIESAVVYSNAAKMRDCGVRAETLEKFGAVSAESASELAAGMRERAGVDIALSITGIAGPGGETPTKPVGLVWFGIATPRGVTTVERRYLGLERNQVRTRAAHQALDFIRRAALGEY